jgi:hypothetical protein
MSTDAPKVGAQSGVSHNLGHPLGTEGAMRHLDPHEYGSSLSSCGTAVLQIRSHATDVRRPRQTLDTRSFTAHYDLAGAPVDIVEPQRSDFARPHTKTDQHCQNGDVAAASPSAPIA